MQGTYVIEVLPKKGVADPLGHQLQEDAYHLGIRRVKRVSTSQLYRLVGELTRAQRTRVAQDLLADPVIQEFRDAGVVDGEKGISKSNEVIVDVWYKPGVTDVIGESVLKGLHDLEMNGITSVRTGMRYRFEGLKDAKAAESLALSLLSNPLIHDQVIHAH